MKVNYIIIAVLLAIIVVLGVIIFRQSNEIGYLAQELNKGAVSGETSSVSQSGDIARQLDNLPFYLRGEIAEIGDDFIKVRPVGATTLKTVKIAENTALVERVLKPQAELTPILTDYFEQRAKSPENISFPKTWASEKKIAFGDLKVGDSVSVFADGDIQTQDSFVAAIVARTIAK